MLSTLTELDWTEWSHLVPFSLMWVRLLACICCLPRFFGQLLSWRSKIAVATWISFAVTPADPGSHSSVSHLTITVVAQEILIGLAFGLSAAWVITAFQMAGCMISGQNGGVLSRSSQSNPASPVSRLLSFSALTALLTTGSHRLLIDGLLCSVRSLPAGSDRDLMSVGEFLAALLASSFEFSVRTAAPVGTVLLAASVVTAVVSRSVRAFDFFGIGLQLNSFLLILTLLFVLAWIPIFVDGQFETILSTLQAFLRSLQAA